MKLTAALTAAIGFLATAGSWLANHHVIEISDVPAVNTAGAALIPSSAIILGAIVWHYVILALDKYAPSLKAKITSDSSSTPSSGAGTSGGISPLLLLGMTSVALMAGGLMSCSNFTTSGITGTLSYVDGKPAVSLTVPIKDSTGAVVGSADISGSDGSKPSVTVNVGSPAVAPVVNPPAVEPGSGK